MLGGAGNGSRERRRTLSQLRLRLLGSYPLSSPSSIFTISPSHDAFTLSSRNVWISSSSLVFMYLANANSPSTHVKAPCRSSRRSRKGFFTTDWSCGQGVSRGGDGEEGRGWFTSPFKNNRSNANTQTFTLTSSTLTSFRFRVISCWKGSTFFSSRSHATVSQSKTKLLVSVLTQESSFARTSGYFFDRSSEFREKMAARPFLSGFDELPATAYCSGESAAT